MSDLTPDERDSLAVCGFTTDEIDTIESALLPAMRDRWRQEKADAVHQRFEGSLLTTRECDFVAEWLRSGGDQ